MPDESEIRAWWMKMSDWERCCHATNVAEQMGAPSQQIVYACEKPWKWMREAYALAHGTPADEVEEAVARPF